MATFDPYRYTFQTFGSAVDYARVSSVSHKFRDHANESSKAQLEASGLGKTLLKRHRRGLIGPVRESEFPLPYLAMCVETCPIAGHNISVDHNIINGLDHLSIGDVYPISEVSGWCKVLFEVDGVVIYESIECHYQHTRFAVARLSIPTLFGVLSAKSRRAWLRKEPLKRNDEVEQCWEEGYEMYMGFYDK